MSIIISGLVDEVSIHPLQPVVTLYKGDRYDEAYAKLNKQNVNNTNILDFTCLFIYI